MKLLRAQSYVHRRTGKQKWGVGFFLFGFVVFSVGGLGFFLSFLEINLDHESNTYA